MSRTEGLGEVGVCDENYRSSMGGTLCPGCSLVSLKRGVHPTGDFTFVV